MDTKEKPLALGIAGSPRRAGNSTALLKAFLEGASEAGCENEIIYLNDMTFRGCQGCDVCVEGRECPVKDDVAKILPLLSKARIWAMASPVYYDGVSGQLKIFFDRLRFTTYRPNNIKGPRRGIIIITYADDRQDYYHEMAARLAKYFSWRDRGDFGEVRVVAEPNLSGRNDWKDRPDLLNKLNRMGRELGKEVVKLGS